MTLIIIYVMGSRQTRFFCQKSKSVICHIHMIYLPYILIQGTIRYVHITWGSLKGHCLLVGSHISTSIHLPGVISGATIVYSSYSFDMADDSIPWINHHGFVVPANGPIAAYWLRKSPLWINPFDAMWFRVILLIVFWRYLVDKSDSRLLEFRESWKKMSEFITAIVCYGGPEPSGRY